MGEEQEALGEATFRFKVENFSSIEDSVFSKPYIIRNLPWKIKIMKSLFLLEDFVGVGYFIQCNGESQSSTWSCYANADLRSESIRSTSEIKDYFTG